MPLKFPPWTPVADKHFQEIGKITSKKLVALLYTNDKWTKKEISETTPFTIASNNVKYFGVTLTKQMKDLFD